MGQRRQMSLLIRNTIAQGGFAKIEARNIINKDSQFWFQGFFFSINQQNPKSWDFLFKISAITPTKKKKKRENQNCT